MARPLEMAYDLYDGDSEDKKIPVILMHGWYWNKLMFADVAKKLAQMAGRKVYNVDMRGHGETPDPERKICNQVMVDDLSYFLDCKNILKASFVCHSIASVFSHMLAIQQPNKVEKIVMIDHQPFRPSAPFELDIRTSQYRIQSKFLTKLNEEPSLSLSEGRQRLRQQATSTKGQRAFMEKLALDLTKIEDKFQWTCDLEYLHDRCISEDLFRKPKPEDYYEGPILIIRNKNSDFVDDSTFADVLKLNPNCQMQTFDHTSHLIPFERPTSFLKAVTEFLNSEK